MQLRSPFDYGRLESKFVFGTRTALRGKRKGAISFLRWNARISFELHFFYMKEAGLMHTWGTTDELPGDIKTSFFP